MVDVRKTQWSVFIGFLFLILLSILLYLFQSARTGGVIALWVLFIVFGAVALILASFAIGYILLLLTKQEEEPHLNKGSEVSYRRTAQQPQKGTWIDLAQLHTTARPLSKSSSKQVSIPQKKRSVRRTPKKKRR